MDLGYEAGSAQPVGRLLPNPLGLFDMLGNAAEWSANYVDVPLQPGKDGVVSDPEFPGVAQGPRRCVTRGGHRNDVPGIISSSLRSTSTASLPYYGIGFRIARTLP